MSNAVITANLNGRVPLRYSVRNPARLKNLPTYSLLKLSAPPLAMFFETNIIEVWINQLRIYIIVINKQYTKMRVAFYPRILLFAYKSMQGVLKPFEVRDRRIKEKFDIDDAYLDGWAKKCKVYATGVYVSLCRRANKEQYCWPSLEKIAEEHSMSIRQVSRALTILEKYNIIVKERLGKKCNNRYWLIDKSEWTDSPIISNSDRTDSPVTMDSQSNHHRTDSPLHSKDTHYKDTQVTIAAEKNLSAASEVFSLKEYLEEMKASKQAHIRIIAIFLEKKGVKLVTREQAQIAIKRHLRAARDLSKFTNEQIERAVRIAEEQCPDKWTIETLIKYITK